MTDAQLAEQFGIELDKFHDLRKRHNWPCVRLGRFEYRFTEAQVEQIVAMHSSARPKKSQASKPAVPGQTARSAARSKS
jgi:hypothetical protein